MARALLIGGGVVLLFIALVLGSCISFQNNAVRLENAVKAQFQDNKNTYDAFWKKVVETAQIPDKYKEDFKDLLVSETKARYGEGGTDATMLWLQERQINFDATMYNRLMTIIEEGRNDFRTGQTRLVDRKRVYEDHLGVFPGSTWAGMTGFPRPVMGELAPTTDLDGDGLYTVLDYKVMTSAKTEKAFQTGEDEALDVFGKKSEK